MSAREVMKVNMGSAVSLVRALDELGLRGAVKWPNDVYIEGRKVAGILLDARVRDGEFVVFLGIGVNVNQRLESFSEEVATRGATSIASELGREVSREGVLASICNALEGSVDMEFERVFEEYRATNMLLGKSIWVTSRLEPDSGRTRAVVADVTVDGRLLVKTDDGGEKELLAEEVSVRETDG